MPAYEEASDKLYACAWCTQRVRKRLTGTLGESSFACPMCGRPMYPLPEDFPQVTAHVQHPQVTSASAEALSRA